jgi:diguanylate cyclase (GGDEF)-like protein
VSESTPPLPLLDHLVRVTAHRDRDSLALSLARTLLDLLPASHVVIWKPCVWQGQDGLLSAELVHRGGTGAGHPAFRALEASPEFAEAEATGLMVEVRPEGGPDRLVLPLRGQREVYLFLELVGVPSGSEEDRRILKGFLTVFRNFVTLLEQGERDTLTGLLNRRTFEARLAQILQSQREAKQAHALLGARRSPEAGWQAWLAILDIDHFKRVNDRFGHAYGDEVLLTFSQIARRCFRRNDLLFRFGGEEFVVILEPSTEADGALALERFREAVANQPFGQVGSVTVSIGYVAVDMGLAPSELVHRADQALYFAKEHGRNQVRSHGRLLAEGLLHLPSVEGGDVDLF